MKVRSIALSAALAVLSVAAAKPAFAVGNVLTPISGADFKQISTGSFTGTLGRADGLVMNTSQTWPVTVGASLGKAAGSSQRFTVVGIGNVKTITCTVTATPVNLGDGPSFTTVRSITPSGKFSLVIDAAANGSSSEESFYSIDCVLPVAHPLMTARIIGVFPSNVTPLQLRPVTGAAFYNLPGSSAYHALGYMLNSTSSPATVEASLGRYNGVVNMQIFGQNGGSTLRCDVIVQDENGDGTPRFFTGTTNASGMFQLNILASTSANGVAGYYTVRCTLPAVGGGRSAAILGVAPDRSGSSLFAGLSGYYFAPLFPESTPTISYSGGTVYNGGDAQMVEGSLGHAAGGPVPIFVYGQFNSSIGPGAGVTCYTYAVNQATGSIQGPWTGSATFGTGTLNRWRLEAAPNAPSGAYFYTMRCSLPRGASISGIQ